MKKFRNRAMACIMLSIIAIAATLVFSNSNSNNKNEYSKKARILDRAIESWKQEGKIKDDCLLSNILQLLRDYQTQSDRFKEWNSEWGDMLSDIRSQGNINDTQWAEYLLYASDPEVSSTVLSNKGKLDDFIIKIRHNYSGTSLRIGNHLYKNQHDSLYYVYRITSVYITDKNNNWMPLVISSKHRIRDNAYNELGFCTYQVIPNMSPYDRTIFYEFESPNEIIIGKDLNVSVEIAVNICEIQSKSTRYYLKRYYYTNTINVDSHENDFANICLFDIDRVSNRDRQCHRSG